LLRDVLRYKTNAVIDYNLNLAIDRRQHRVFTTRSKLWSTSRRHIVSESTAISFIPRQYSWDYRQEHERIK